MQIEAEAFSRIQDIKESKGGIITIATSTNISYYVIPKICEQYKLKFPKIDINIIHTKTSELADMLTNNTADLIFTPTEATATDFTVIPIIHENLIVAVRKDYKSISHILDKALSYNDILNKNLPEEKKITDMSVFHGVDFVYSSPDSNIYKKRKLIFSDTNSYPSINTSSQNQKLDYNLMRSSFGALLTTDADIATMPNDDNLIFFALKSSSAKQSFCIAHSKTPDSPQYKIIDDFIKTAVDIFDCENPLEKLL